MEAILKTPLSNAQLELLGLFSENLSEKEFLELKKMIVAWRFKKLKASANKAWDERAYTADDMERLLKADLRKPYKSQNEFLDKLKSKKNQGS